jgi:hypothetical protein
MAVARTKDGQLKKGSVLNPKGRPVGSKDRFTQVKAAFVTAFEELGGAEGLLGWMTENEARQGEFYRMVVALMPKDLSIEAVDSRRSASEYDTGELVAMLGEPEQLEHKDAGETTE